MKIYTEQQMRAAEQMAADAGMAFLRLMENAGSACASEIKKRTHSGQRIALLCGKGKNGGDGFVIARKLCEAGYSAVAVLLAQGNPADADAQYMLDSLRGTSVSVYDLTQNETASQMIGQADVLVDAVFGIGFHGEVREPLASLFRQVNAAEATVFSVDVPSGMACDSGALPGVCVQADYTLAISAGKLCHVLQPAAAQCGKVRLVRIGVEDTHYKAAPYVAYSLSEKEVRAVFPNRPAVSNKGTFGKVLCIVGSRRYAGAAVLASRGALRSGAGLVYTAFPDAAYAAVAPNLIESPLLPMPSDSEGRFALSAVPQLIEAMQGMQAIVLGCGLGQSAGMAELVQTVLEHAECPVILDADGLNAVSGNIDILRKATCKRILTPHPGEMQRLTGKSIEEIQSDRMGTAKAFAAEYGVTLVLKGANTVVANGKSGAVFLNTTGNSGLAKGGSGDLLAGMIGGFAAQGVHFPAETAVYLHGQCGDVAADRLSARGMLPTDAAEMLPHVLLRLE